MIKSVVSPWLLFLLISSNLFAQTPTADKTFAISNGTNPRLVHQWTTPKGVHVVFYQAMEVPLLDITIGFHAGSAYDGEHFGLSTLSAQLLNQGNKQLNANQIAEKLAETGAQYESENSQDLAVFHLKTLSEARALKKATETFALIINHPDFPSDAFQQIKNQQLMAIAQTKESPEAVANETFFKMLYKEHPYAHPVMGDEEHVNKLTKKDVGNFYHHYFVSHNAVLVLVGAIDQATAHQIAQQLTQNLADGPAAPPLPLAPALKEGFDIEVKFPSTQSVLRLGQMGINHHDPRYFPLMVGNYSLGGANMVSRLSQTLRENRGLTYGVYSQFVPMPGNGPFFIGLSTKQDQTKTALTLTQETLSNFITNGISEDDLKAAKQFLTGSFPLSLASNRSIADMLLKMAVYHLPDDFLLNYVQHINAVTREEIKTAFQELIKPHDLLQVTVGNMPSP
jgi:zinc protease